MFTVYPSNGSFIKSFDDKEEAYAYANKCGHNSSVWNEDTDCEVMRVW